MSPALRSAAIIPAAGLGTRLNKGPKGLLTLEGRTLTEWVVHTLRPLVEHIVIAAPAGYESELAHLLPDCTVICGGNSRHDSIVKLMSHCDAHTILLQDAARPFASRALSERVLKAAELHGAAGAFLTPSVPLGQVQDQQVSHFWHRHQVGIFQAPQAYASDLLKQALKTPNADQFQSTAQLMMSMNHSLYAVEGEEENIKITSPLDWDIAQSIIAPKLRHRFS